MAADTQILREYLVALGFRVDEAGERKVSNKLTKWDKGASALGKTLIAAAAASVVLTTTFARSMEKLYYSARYADTTVGKLQAMEFAGRNVGLAGGEMASSMKNFAAAMRGNPGLAALLEKMGVQVKGRTVDKVMIDFVKATKQMPFFVGQRYASLFGMDQETLFNLQEGVDKLEAAAKAREEMAKDFGVDPDAIAQSAVEYMNMWRNLSEEAGVFGMAIGSLVLPKVRELMSTTEDLLHDWMKISREIDAKGAPDFWQRIREGVTNKAEGGGVKLTPEAALRAGVPFAPEHGKLDWFGVPRAMEDWQHWRDTRDQKKGRKPKADEATVDAVTDSSDFEDKHPRMSEAERAARVQRALDAGVNEGGPGRDYANVDSIPDSALKPGPRRGKLPPPQEDEGAGDTSPGGKDYGNVDQIPDTAIPRRRTRKARQASAEEMAYLQALERNYALPEGLLDRTWLQESGRGVNMRSPAGAKGHFGFMDPTAREYGMDPTKGDPDDFKKSALAAAQKYQHLLKQFHGNVRMSAAAFNLGEGNLAKIDYNLGRAPRETQEYADKVGGPANGVGDVTMHTEVNVYGVSDPKQAADTVVRKQRDVAGDLVRNLSPKVR